MSNNPNDILLHQLFNLFINRFGSTAKIPSNYMQQMSMINDIYSNDYTGLISTIMEYMIHSGSVDFTFQTNDASLRKLLENWQKNVNQGLSVDIQRGLRSVTSQYMRERWKSSFIGIKVVWANDNGFSIPKNIYLVDGSQIKVSGDTSILGGYTYSLGSKNTPLIAKPNESLIIRKPFNSWYDIYPTPYLIKKGTMYNALLKRELLKKQGDILEAILPYMFAIKAGSDALSKINQLPTEGELNALADQIKEIKEEYSTRLKSKGTVGAFPHDVSFEHVIPDLGKMFDEKLIKPIDRNILSSLGMIELTGFSKNREEALLNPKLLVEEVKEAVVDLSLIYEDIMLEFIKRNSKKIGDKNIIVLPGTITSFITSDMKLLARSAYDRGLISKRRFNEDYMELNFEAEVQQIDLENRRNLQQRMFPPVILNQDSNSNSDTPNATPENSPLQPQQVPQKKKPGKNIKAKCSNPTCNFIFAVQEDTEEHSVIECPECKHQELFLDAKTELYLQAPYENIDQLPPAVKNHLPKSAQKLFMKVVNQAIKKGLPDSDAFREAWHVVKLHYFKTPNGKWRKKKKSKKANDLNSEVINKN